MKIRKDSRIRSSWQVRSSARECLVLVILVCSVLVISKNYNSRCKSCLCLYQQKQKEKDLKMHFFLAKTKNALFGKLSCFKKIQESTSVYFLKCDSDCEQNNSYLKEISIFSSFFLVLNLCWWVQVKCWWVLLQCW